MANTTIQLKKSIISGRTPASLASGEIAINTADGIIFYADPNNVIRSISSSISSVNTFSTVNANSSLLIATSQNDILSISGNGAILVSGNYLTDTITIDSKSATTSQQGVVQLYDGLDSTSTVLAATSNSVNTVANSKLDKLQFANITSNNISTSNNTANQVIDIFSSSSYRSVKYLLQITNGTNYQISEINLIHDGTNSYLTEYGLITTNGVLINYDTDINSGNVRLLMSPINNTNTIKVVRTIINI